MKEVEHSWPAVGGMALLILPGLFLDAVVLSSLWHTLLADRFGPLSLRAAVGILLVVFFVMPSRDDGKPVTARYVLHGAVRLLLRCAFVLGLAAAASWGLR
jgi:hypothetical protein